MSSRAELMSDPRVVPTRRLLCTIIGALCILVSMSPARALADVTSPEQTAPLTAIPDFPKKLAITAVGDEHMLSTFAQRVSSWFSDGTEVSLAVTSEWREEQLLASNPAEVRAWVVPLSSQSALLTFSCVSPPAAPRHLVREVRLHSGFDELGLERLASVIHSAFVALSQGAEGVEREQAQLELSKVGAAALPAPSNASIPLPTAPTAPAMTTPLPVAPKGDAATRPSESRASLLVAAGYGVRLRGPEGVGHGPRLELGVLLRRPRTDFVLQLSGQYSFRSEFEAAPYFEASVQSSALRVQVGIEPRLKSSLFVPVLLGLGADIAHVASRANESSSEVAMPHSEGTQARAMGEVSLGIVHRGELLDIGVIAQAIFALQDVRYSAMTSDGEMPLVTPWPVQPALSLQGRFRNPL